LHHDHNYRKLPIYYSADHKFTDYFGIIGIVGATLGFNK
jgi:hypothetical protein